MLEHVKWQEGWAVGGLGEDQVREQDGQGGVDLGCSSIHQGSYPLFLTWTCPKGCPQVFNLPQ